MKKTYFKFSASLGLSAFLASCNPVNTNEQQSAAKFADVKVTSTKDQGDAGFCWAYTTIAMIEADYLARTGMSIDLSEEALGYVKVAHDFEDYINCNLEFDIDPTSGRDICGKNRMSEGGLSGSSDENTFKHVFAGDLIKRWGLVPESQWNVKFNYENNSFSKVYPKVKDDLAKVVLRLQSEGKKVVSMAEVFNVLNKGLFGSSPPFDGFNNGSGFMNSVQYAQQVIGFQKESLITRSVTKENFSNEITNVVAALGRGKSVGIMTSLLEDQLHGNLFEGWLEPGTVRGAHAMLITDIRNPNSSYGYTGESVSSFASKINTDSRFLLKNSWGTGTNEFGNQVFAGAYEMEIGFLHDVLMSKNGWIKFVYYETQGDGSFAPSFGTTSSVIQK